MEFVSHAVTEKLPPLPGKCSADANDSNNVYQVIQLLMNIIFQFIIIFMYLYQTLNQ